uniref:Uncharacterized protein n=1 Tax=Rhizophora mucronata TaxID=61149 RepID=A0A2P2N3V9_RHIMU
MCGPVSQFRSSQTLIQIF